MSKPKTRIGRPCKHHPELMGERYASNGSCVQCEKERSKNAFSVRTMALTDEMAVLHSRIHQLQVENEAIKADKEDISRILAAIDKKLRGDVNDPDPLPTIMPGSFSFPTTYGLVMGLLRERNKIKTELEELRRDAERFRYIQQDADSGMRRIYGDDWVATIDAQGFQQ